MENETLESVKRYYGSVLKTKEDLKTSACCTADAMPVHLRDIQKLIHQEIQEKFYGCGSPIPSVLEGKTVLDLGAGTGRDCYILSKLVGPSGHVIGVDMTDEQLGIARRHINYHTDRFGYAEPNVQFLKGYIEDLKSIGIEDRSVDVVVSNCVLNLSPAKERVFSEIFRVLKTGGELYFSDVFADRRIPRALASDPELLGECLGGALYSEDFRRLLLKLGCADFRIVTKSRLSLNSPEIERKVGMIGFYSMTLRAFNLPIEDRCEDYGQVAYYLGGIAECPHAFVLDDHHVFKVKQPVLVCSNTAAMLSQSRYAAYFKIVGDTSTHYGLFDCNPTRSAQEAGSAMGVCC